MNKYIKNFMKNLNPGEWFENPLDKMPLATDNSASEPKIGNGTNKYAPPERMAELEAETNLSWEDTAPSEYEPPDEEWFGEKKPEPKKEEEITMHEKMYRMATAKYNPFAVGGSENLGGSENAQKL